mmetsp:Transcript_43553/g.100303  ORF Transcript_43553/g.100303 Transcript_43553/m.100303 type:complete len:855 (+) Transcript_43553:74-2638(+)
MTFKQALAERLVALESSLFELHSEEIAGLSLQNRQLRHALAVRTGQGKQDDLRQNGDTLISKGFRGLQLRGKDANAQHVLSSTVLWRKEEALERSTVKGTSSQLECEALEDQHQSMDQPTADDHEVFEVMQQQQDVVTKMGQGVVRPSEQSTVLGSHRPSDSTEGGTLRLSTSDRLTASKRSSQVMLSTPEGLSLPGLSEEQERQQNTRVCKQLSTGTVTRGQSRHSRLSVGSNAPAGRGRLSTSASTTDASMEHRTWQTMSSQATITTLATDAGEWHVRVAWQRASSRLYGTESLAPMRTTRSRRPERVSFTAKNISVSRCSMENQCMLDPSSRRRFMWDALASVMILYDITTLPMNWGFGWALPDVANVIMTWVVMAFFTTDIPLTCFTGYYSEGRLVMRPKKVLANYAKSYMFLDMLAVLPDWVVLIMDLTWGHSEGGYFRISKSMRMLRILRTVKLVRLARLNRFASELIAGIQNEYWMSFFKIGKLSALLLLVSHYAACGWFALGDTQSGGWVSDEMRGRSFLRQYLTCLEWSLSNYTGGVFWADASTVAELSYACLVCFLSMLLGAYLVSSFTNTISHMTRFHGQSIQRRWHINQFMQDQRVTKTLQVRVRKYLTQVANQNINDDLQDISSIFVNMPPYLLMELNAEVIAPVLYRHHMLKSCATTWPLFIHKMCQDCVHQVRLIEEEILFAVHEDCRYLSFPIDGLVLYEHSEGGEENVEKHRWYSEVAMYLSFVHCGSMRCLEVAQFICLVLDAFERIISQHPGLHRELMDQAIEVRTWALERQDSEGAISDLTVTDTGYRAVERMCSVATGYDGGQSASDTPINPSLQLLKVASKSRRGIDFSAAG